MIIGWLLGTYLGSPDLKNGVIEPILRSEEKKSESINFLNKRKRGQANS